MSNILSRLVLAIIISLATVGTAAASTPDKYVGLTVDDDADLGITSKVQVKDFGSSSISIRPSATFGSDTNLTLPVTYDKSLGSKLDVYGGVGVNVKTIGTDDYGLVGIVGADYALSKKLVANGSFKFGNSESLQIGLGFGF